MSCCGTSPGFEEIDEVSRLVAAKLAAFLRTLREAGFAVGLQEGQDAAALMAAGYAERPILQRVGNAIKAIHPALSERYLSDPVPGRKKSDFLYSTGLGFSWAR